MHRFFDRFWHWFFFDSASILEPNLEPCWPLFRSKHGDCERAVGGLCWVYLLFRFLGRPGPLLAPSGLDLGRFGPPFWRFLVPIFFIIFKFFASTFSATLALCWSIFFTKIWFVMGWWSYAKRKGFLYCDISFLMIFIGSFTNYIILCKFSRNFVRI